MSFVRVDTGSIRFTNPATGKALSGGKVYTRDNATGQLVTTYQNQSGSVENEQKITLDIFGECKIFYNNLLTLEVYDSCGRFINKYMDVGALSPGDPNALPVLENDSTQSVPDTLSDGDLLTVLDETTREGKGVAIPSTITLNGNKVLGSILGAYSVVLNKFALTGSPIPAEAIVIGDTNGYRYKLLIAGDSAINPESEIYDSFTGLGTNWRNLEIQSTNELSYHWQNRDFYTDSGAANAYVLSSVSPNINVEQYDSGMALAFIAQNTNSGPATINVDGFGVKAIVDTDGNALLGTEISTSAYNFARYDAANDRFVLVSQAGGGGGSSDVGFQIDGLVFTSDPGDGITTPFENVVINPGRCKNETFQFTMVNAAAISKKFGDAYSEGPGGGMRPPAVVINPGQYMAIFLMAKADGTIDIGLDVDEAAVDLRAAAPTYVFFRRIMWLPAFSGSTYCDISQQGDNFRLGKSVLSAVGQTLINAAGGNESITFKAPAPPNTRLFGFLSENTLVPTPAGGFWTAQAFYYVLPTWSTFAPSAFSYQVKYDVLNGNAGAYELGREMTLHSAFEVEVDENQESQVLVTTTGQPITGQLYVSASMWSDRRLQDGVQTPNSVNHVP